MTAAEHYNYLFTAYVALGYSIEKAVFTALVDAGLITEAAYRSLMA